MEPKIKCFFFIDFYFLEILFFTFVLSLSPVLIEIHDDVNGRITGRQLLGGLEDNIGFLLIVVVLVIALRLRVWIWTQVQLGVVLLHVGRGQ